MRYTESHIEIIRIYLSNENDGDYKVLDQMKQHLRFLNRYDKAVRQQIYKVSDFVEILA